MSDEETETPRPDTSDWQDVAVDAAEPSGEVTSDDVEPSVETTPSEGSTDSTGMGSFVNIDTDDYIPNDAVLEPNRVSPSLVLVEHESKNEEEMKTVGDVQRKDSSNKPDVKKDATPSRSNKFLELKQKRRAAATATRNSGLAVKEERKSATEEATTPLEEEDVDVVMNKTKEVVSEGAKADLVVDKVDARDKKDDVAIEEDSKQEEKKTPLDSAGENASEEIVEEDFKDNEDATEDIMAHGEQSKDVKAKHVDATIITKLEEDFKDNEDATEDIVAHGEQSKDVKAKHVDATIITKLEEDFKDNEDATEDIVAHGEQSKDVEAKHVDATHITKLEEDFKDSKIAPLLVEEINPVGMPNANTPRGQNHRMKHVMKVRQKVQSPTKASIETNENVAVETTPSIATSASQVTAKHHNGVRKTSVPVITSTISLISDASSFGTDDSTLSSEHYLKEKERLRLRKIALQTVAGPFASDHLATLKETKSSSSGSANPCDNDQFDPFASTVTEVEMKPIGNVILTPSQAPDQYAGFIKSANTSSSSSSAPTQTFQKLAPIRAENGFVDIGRLILVGVVGLVGGVMLSVFALNTCEFVTIRKEVGYYNETLIVHAGMSSFTSMDSVFLGGNDCTSYDHAYYGEEPPVFAKASAMLALISGVLAATVVWVYIFTTRTTASAWTAATVLAGAASILQLLTFQFFFSTVCSDDDCGIGLGSLTSFIAVCVYGYMAFEMNGNCPVQRIVLPGMVNDLIEKSEVLVKGMNDAIVKQRDISYSAPELV